MGTETQVEQAVQTAKTTVEAGVKTARNKVVAFVLAHVPTVVAAVGGYAAGSFGIVSKLFKLV